MNKGETKAGINSDSLAPETVQDAYRRTNFSHFWGTASAEIAPVLHAERWAVRHLADQERGFRSEGLACLVRKKIVSYFLEIFEGLLGSKLYVKIDDWDFLETEPRFEKIAVELKEAGILSWVKRGEFRPDWPAVPYYACALAPIPTSQWPITLKGSIAGVNFDANTALAATIAEIMERYSLCTWVDKKIIKGSYGELAHSGAIDPFEFKSFSDAQLVQPEMREQHAFTEDTKFGWVEGFSFLDDKKVLLPAQLAYISYSQLEHEPAIRVTNTSGAGAGESRARAICSAILENLERDAISIYWLNSIAPPRVDHSSLTNKDTLRLLSEFKRHNIEVHILDITTDLEIPVFAVMTLDRSGRGLAAHLSAASDLNPEEAVLHALFENVKGGQGTFQLLNEKRLEQARANYPHLNGVLERTLWWSLPEALEHAEWFCRGHFAPIREQKHFYENWEEKLGIIKKIFQNKRQEVYIIDVTSSIAKRYGLYIVMSLIPGFYPLYLNERNKYLGIPRLFEVPVRLGFLKVARKEQELNQIPSPMA